MTDNRPWTWWCGYCDINWPNDGSRYTSCPICEKHCDHERDIPLTPVEANRKITEYRNHQEKVEAFERYWLDKATEELRAELDEELAKLLC